MFVKSSAIDYDNSTGYETKQVTNVLKWLFQICVATLVVLFSLPFLVLILFVVVLLLHSGPQDTSGVGAVAGGISLPAWFFIALALPLLFAGLYLITRWVKHRR